MLGTNKTRKLGAAAGAALMIFAGAAVTGCGKKAAENDAEMRKAMTKKNWNINDVPPEQRARVQALMRQNNQGNLAAPPGPAAPR